MNTSQQTGATITALCDIFRYSRQAYYKSLKTETKRQKKEQIILQAVHQIRIRQPKVGTRKLKRMLASMGLIVGRDALFDLLGRQDLFISRKRTRPFTTMGWHHYHKHPNLIKDLKVTAPNQVFVSDITFLPGLNRRFYYLALITDLFSRKIVGYDLSEDLTTDGSLRALNMALRPLTGDINLIHHSDRGLQYCAHAYVNRLHDKGVRISMTEQDHVYENALAERVNGILKQEFLLDRPHASFDLAKKQVNEAIYIYNHERLHMSIDWRTPLQVHQSLN
jgi:transposase InsO family protein